MRVYLASPNTQQQAQAVAGMPVLLSFAIYADWLALGYHQSFSHILIDSGAFSEMTTGKRVCVEKYRDWSERWLGHADAIAGLDDIQGDWKKSLKNYKRVPWGFPTIHDTDPPELLPELIEIARDRGGWLGIGLKPPRQGKERFVRSICEAVPDDLKIHGWALRAYTHVRRLNSVDSTNWWRDGMKLRTIPDLAHLNYSECLEIVVKRYQRWQRTIKSKESGFFV